MWSHSMDGNNHFSQPAGYSFAVAAQDAVDLLCCKVNCWLVVPQDSQISIWKSFPTALASSSWSNSYSVPDAGCRATTHWTLWGCCQPISPVCSGCPGHWPLSPTLLWFALYFITEITDTVTITVPSLEAHWPPAGPAPADRSPWDQWSSQCSTLSSTYPIHTSPMRLKEVCSWLCLRLC